MRNRWLFSVGSLSRFCYWEFCSVSSAPVDVAAEVEVMAGVVVEDDAVLLAL